MADFAVAAAYIGFAGKNAAIVGVGIDFALIQRGRLRNGAQIAADIEDVGFERIGQAAFPSVAFGIKEPKIFVADGGKRFAEFEISSVGEAAARFVDAQRRCFKQFAAAFYRGKMDEKTFCRHAFAADACASALRRAAARNGVAQNDAGVAVRHALIALRLRAVDIEAQTGARCARKSLTARVFAAFARVGRFAYAAKFAVDFGRIWTIIVGIRI